MEDIILSMEENELPEISLIDEEFDGVFGMNFGFVDISHLPPANSSNSHF